MSQAIIRDDLAKAFNNDPVLQKFVLTDVTATGRILGNGCFGSVEEVSYTFSSLEKARRHAG